MLRLLSCGCLLATTFASTGTAEEFRIAPDTDLKPVLKQVSAGDRLTLQDGIWADADLTFDQVRGTADKPIVISAATPGKVILTGRTQFRLSGQHVVVSGIVIRNPVDISDVLQLRTHSERHAHHCRITDCVIESEGDFNAEGESRWVSVYGSHNRIDHCYLAGKKNRGTTLVVWIGETPGQHTIEHNHFGPRPELGRNGGETIRIGTSDVSERSEQTTVANNYFHRCDGEAEIVSNKSCDNIYRHNTFDECSGTLTLRHGHRCTVDGNVFFGREQRGTGGVRIIGSDHVVINNYFDGLRGDGERAALSMMNGVPNSPLNQYAPVQRAQVSHNTFVDCKVSLEIGVGAGKKQSVAPVDCHMTHNLFLPGKWEISRQKVQPVSFTWTDNKQHTTTKRPTDLATFETIDLKFAPASDGLLRPTLAEPLLAKTSSDVATDIDATPRTSPAICGCDVPNADTRALSSAHNTGPTWKKN